MKEIVYDFKEFQDNVDRTRPIHYSAIRKLIDKEGVFYEVICQLTGVHKNDNYILIFERRADFSIAEREKQKEILKKFKQKYADPLNATEGRWK